eukprot:8904594-Alexandrium_andersonii.AAC.1
MSASLVGSEMCIRDSPSGDRASGGSPGGAVAPVALSLLWGRSRTACPRTVSYTHLTLPTICSV